MNETLPSGFGFSSDDISAMYCQLRKLVLEYLGITTPSTCQVNEPSDLETSPTDLSMEGVGQGGEAVTSSGPAGADVPCDDQRQFSKSAPVGGRDGPRHSWSRPSLVDCSDVGPAANQRPQTWNASMGDRGVVVSLSWSCFVLSRVGMLQTVRRVSRQLRHVPSTLFVPYGACC